MKKIEFNEDNLTENEIDKVVKKVRAFVVNPNTNQVLLVHYAGLYMLPGGSIDPGEEENIALAREVLEEAGIEVDTSIAIPFLSIASYDKNYFDRKSGTINRLTQTTFFEITTLEEIDESKKKLTASEKEKNHSISFVNLSDFRTIILNNQTDNPKRPQFDREILTALDTYLDFKLAGTPNLDIEAKRLVKEKKPLS